MTETLKNTTLIIAGHGSSKNPNQALPARKHGEYIRTLDLFHDVKTAFWKEDTFLKDVLETVNSKKIVIVPNLACSGFINQVVIPREMGLDGLYTEKNGRQIYITRPVGEYEGLPQLMAERLKTVMAERGLHPKDTTVFLVAHGNSNPDRPVSHDTTVMMATRIYQHFQMHALLPAFLEEKPFLKGWQDRAHSPNIIVLPFMIAAGMHGAQDIPRYLGIRLNEAQEADLRDDGIPAGPFKVGDQNIWMMRAMGAHPKIADFMVDMAREKLAEQS